MKTGADIKPPRLSVVGVYFKSKHFLLKDNFLAQAEFEEPVKVSVFKIIINARGKSVVFLVDILGIYLFYRSGCILS